SAPHAGDLIDGPFQVLGMVLPAVDDDDVLRPAADEQLAVGEVPQVAGVQPPVPDGPGGQRVVPIVAQHYGRAGQRNFTDLPGWQFPAVLSDNSDPVAGQWSSARHQR